VPSGRRATRYLRSRTEKGNDSTGWSRAEARVSDVRFAGGPSDELAGRPLLTRVRLIKCSRTVETRKE
jgi:hypothetical protein